MTPILGRKEKRQVNDGMLALSRVLPLHMHAAAMCPWGLWPCEEHWVLVMCLAAQMLSFWDHKGRCSISFDSSHFFSEQEEL